MTKIFLVQHADKERLPGDPGLTELGSGQAAVTARWLHEMRLHALYTSPLRRARETAAPISRSTGLVAQVDSRLRERLNWDGTATFDAFLAGLSGRSGPVAAVSHGGVTVELLRTLLGDDGIPPRVMDEGIPPCAITTLDDLHVIAIAATGHLS